MPRDGQKKKLLLNSYMRDRSVARVYDPPCGWEEIQRTGRTR